MGAAILAGGTYIAFQCAIQRSPLTNPGLWVCSFFALVVSIYCCERFDASRPPFSIQPLTWPVSTYAASDQMPNGFRHSSNASHHRLRSAEQRSPHHNEFEWNAAETIIRSSSARSNATNANGIPQLSPRLPSSATLGHKGDRVQPQRGCGPNGAKLRSFEEENHRLRGLRGQRTL